MSLLDLIYPKRCVGCRRFGAYICSSCFSYITFSQSDFCTVCQRPAIDGLTHPRCKTRFEIDGVLSSVAYKGIVKRLIHHFKYNPYISDLRNVLCDLFYEGIIQKEIFFRVFSERSIFVPIPLHRGRMRERGFNQSKILAEGLVKKFQHEKSMIDQKPIVVMDFLQRTKRTSPQFGLSQKARIVNMAGAFVIKKEFVKKIKTAEPVIFLIDDIVTTGATLREAARVLKRAGAVQVYGLALSHGR